MEVMRKCEASHDQETSIRTLLERSTSCPHLSKNSEAIGMTLLVPTEEPPQVDFVLQEKVTKMENLIKQQEREKEQSLQELRDLVVAFCDNETSNNPLTALRLCLEAYQKQNTNKEEAIKLCQQENCNLKESLKNAKSTFNTEISKKNTKIHEMSAESVKLKSKTPNQICN